MTYHNDIRIQHLALFLMGLLLHGKLVKASREDQKNITPVISDRFKMRIALAKEDIWSIRLPSRDGDVNSVHTFSKAFCRILAVFLN